MSRRFVLLVVAAGSLAAAADIVYAFIWLGPARSPAWVLQSVASGWMGKQAFAGGATAAAIGLASHFGICIVAAAIYGAVSLRAELLRRHWLACGALFGICVYLFMNFVVLPLSAFPFKLSYPVHVLAQGFVSHAVLVGIPIAWFFRKAGSTPI
jgi:uncharacterized membrane protein YagU involved in acid resistance